MPRIDRIEAYPIAIPFLREFRTSAGLIGSPSVPGPHVYVKITADDGTVGWGECRPPRTWTYETPETVVSTIRVYLAPALKGLDPRDTVGAHRTMDREIAPGPSGGQPIAKSAIDLALHDLAARIEGVNVARLWGREPGKMTLSFTVTASDPEGIHRQVEEGRRSGYRNFNCKIGHDPRTDRAILRAMREAAPDGFLWADANRGYHFEAAVDILPALQQYGFGAFEQPTADPHGRELAAIRAQSGPVRILVDEVLGHPRDVYEYIRAEAIDGITVKLGRMGGLAPNREVIEVALAAGLDVLVSGLTESGLAMVAACVLGSAYGISFPAALNGPQLLAQPVTKEGWLLEKDTVRLPEGPGFGISVDEDVLARLAREPFAPPPR